MTPPHPTNLIAIPVPEVAHSFEINEWHTGIFYIFNNKKHLYPFIDLRAKKFKILGTVTSDTIDFDVEEHVLALYDDESGDTAEDIFRSLLSANGIHFENPHGIIKPSDGCSFGHDSHWMKMQDEVWQTAQSNLVKKLVILEKI